MNPSKDDTALEKQDKMLVTPAAIAAGINASQCSITNNKVLKNNNSSNATRSEDSLITNKINGSNNNLNTKLSTEKIHLHVYRFISNSPLMNYFNQLNQNSQKIALHNFNRNIHRRIMHHSRYWQTKVT